MKVLIEVEITDQICKEFLTACYEGGSAYWLACNKVKREKKTREVIGIVGPFDREDGSEKWYDITIETMRQGIKKMIEPGELNVAESTRAEAREAVFSPDNANWDADTADCCLQVGMFGKLVYG